jgi:hypothetical protein
MDGTQTFLQFDGSALEGTDYTVFFVEGRSSADSGNYFLGSDISNGLGPDDAVALGYSSDTNLKYTQVGTDINATVAGYTTQTFAVWTIVADFTGGTRKIYKNGTLVGSDTYATPVDTNTIAYLGRHLNDYFKGDMGEVIMYSRAVAGQEFTDINDKLYDKWVSSSPANVFDKTYFDTSGVVYNDTVFASYTPADEDALSEYYKSNMAKHNFHRLYNGTDEESTIELDVVPQIAKDILKVSSLSGGEWTISKGKFINKYNEEIVYEPIRVSINGKLVENRTDYFKQQAPDPEVFKYIGNNYQYYVSGNKVIFNTNIDVPIEISFYRQQDSFRLVSKLYRSNRKIDDITPELYGYAMFINKRD